MSMMSQLNIIGMHAQQKQKHKQEQNDKQEA